MGVEVALHWLAFNFVFAQLVLILMMATAPVFAFVGIVKTFL